MRSSKSRITILYVVAAIAVAACLHSFLTEDVGVSGVTSALLAVVLAWEATRQLRNRADDEGQ